MRKKKKRSGLNRILIHDFAGHAFQVQLSRELAFRGYEIIHLFGESNPTPKGPVIHRSTDLTNFHLKGLKSRGGYSRYSFFERWRNERSYGHLLAREIGEWNPDCMVLCNTPLETQKIVSRVCSQIPSILWLQDLYGIATYEILRRKFGMLGATVGKYYVWLEERLANRSEAVVTIAEDFEKELGNWGVGREKIFTIKNWAPLDEIPNLPKDNAWAREHDISGRVCFLYAGMMGMKHDMQVILDLARHYLDRPEVIIVVVSEGLGANWLKSTAIRESVGNLLVLNFQPYERLAEVLASGDVLVALLTSEAGKFAVPSKVLSYLCAGRALLVSSPKENLISRTICMAEAGYVAEPSRREKFLQLADKLVSDAQLRRVFGKNARAYAEKNFQIKQIADRFEDVINLTC